MACIEVPGQPWTRKHDNPAVTFNIGVPSRLRWPAGFLPWIT
jgi:hypothetical protein